MTIFNYIVFAFIINSTGCFGQEKQIFLINEVLFEIPGEWEARGQLVESGQHHLHNKKSQINLMISARDRKKFDFDKKIKGYELVETFYNWEKDYWTSDNGRKANVEILKKDSTEKYIIWQLNTEVITNDNEIKSISSIFLYTIKKDKLISINYFEDNSKQVKLSTQEIMDYLVSIKP